MSNPYNPNITQNQTGVVGRDTSPIDISSAVSALNTFMQTQQRSTQMNLESMRQIPEAVTANRQSKAYEDQVNASREASQRNSRLAQQQQVNENTKNRISAEYAKGNISVARNLEDRYNVYLDPKERERSMDLGNNAILNQSTNLLKDIAPAINPNIDKDTQLKSIVENGRYIVGVDNNTGNITYGDLDKNTYQRILEFQSKSEYHKRALSDGLGAVQGSKLKAIQDNLELQEQQLDIGEKRFEASTREEDRELELRKTKADVLAKVKNLRDVKEPNQISGKELKNMESKVFKNLEDNDIYFNDFASNVNNVLSSKGIPPVVDVNSPINSAKQKYNGVIKTTATGRLRTSSELNNLASELKIKDNELQDIIQNYNPNTTEVSAMQRQFDRNLLMKNPDQALKSAYSTANSFLPKNQKINNIRDLRNKIRDKSSLGNVARHLLVLQAYTNRLNSSEMNEEKRAYDLNRKVFGASIKQEPINILSQSIQTP